MDIGEEYGEQAVVSRVVVNYVNVRGSAKSLVSVAFFVEAPDYGRGGAEGNDDEEGDEEWAGAC